MEIKASDPVNEKFSNIKLVATDMDGTLLNGRKQRPADFDSWVLSHPEIKTVIASGRQYYALLKQFGKTAERLVLIAEDGGLVFEHGKLLYVNSMKKEDVFRCIEIGKSISGASVVLCGTKCAWMKPAAENVVNEIHLYFERLNFTDDLRSAAAQDEIVKIELYFENGGAERIMKTLPEPGPGLKAVLPDKDWIAIENDSVSKGSALKVIMEKSGLSADECMAFGDYFNDYEMLACVEHSFAMENAHPGLKALARHIAPSNEQEGVMQILRKL